MYTDPIADMLTRIRNATSRRSVGLSLPSSKLKHEIAKLLVAKGYLEAAEVVKEENGRLTLKLILKYRGNHPMIEGIKRISKPGQRIHEGSSKLDKLMVIHTGDTVVSTTSGLLTGREAKKAGLGGEVLFRIW